MREERFAGVTVRLTGGDDREGGGDGPLVVFMHGFGASGTDLVPLWQVLDVPPTTRFAFPEAPLEVPGLFGARAWWMIDFERAERAMVEGPKSYAEEIPAGMEDATDRVVEMLAAMQEALAVPSERMVLGGFSQGSMAACNAVFTRGVATAALVVLSGTPVNLRAWREGMAERQGLPVFQSHGTHDALLSFQAAEQLRDTMRDAGLAGEWVPFRGGHELPVPVLTGLSRFLSTQVSP